MTDATQIRVRAIVDPNGIGCAQHGQKAWGLCSACTLQMLADLASAAGNPILAHEARRVFVGLGALLDANPDAGKFGLGSRDAAADTHTISNADLSRAALAISTAHARLERALDATGALHVARGELAAAIDALGLVVDGAFEVGRRRLAAESPPSTPPTPTPVAPPPSGKTFESSWHAEQGRPRRRWPWSRRS